MLTTNWNANYRLNPKRCEEKAQTPGLQLTTLSDVLDCLELLSLIDKTMSQDPVSAFVRSQQG